MTTLPHTHIRFIAGECYDLQANEVVEMVSNDLRRQRVTVAIDHERKVPCVIGVLTLTDPGTMS